MIKKLKALRGKVIIKIDTRQKEKYALATGVVLEIHRGYNFNLREDRASEAILVDGLGLQDGVNVLVHHLSTEESYHVPNSGILTEEEELSGWKIYSIPEDNVFLYSKGGEDWLPCKNFLITQRMFKPYNGVLEGIGKERVKDRMYIVMGTDYLEGREEDLSGAVAIVTPNSDYEIIWHNKDHRELRLIRTRNREISAIDHTLTEQVKRGEILLGTSEVDCKALIS